MMWWAGKDHHNIESQPGSEADSFVLFAEEYVEVKFHIKENNVVQKICLIFIPLLFFNLSKCCHYFSKACR